MYNYVLSHTLTFSLKVSILHDNTEMRERKKERQTPEANEK